MISVCVDLFHNMATISVPIDSICFPYFVHSFYSLVCPRILRANCISFGIIVTRLACMAHKLVSSKRPIRCASAASCKARIADACQLYVCRARPCWISLTNRANGSRRMSKSVLFWYCRISRSARSPKQQVDQFCISKKYSGTSIKQRLDEMT